MELPRLVRVTPAWCGRTIRCRGRRKGQGGGADGGLLAPCGPLPRHQPRRGQVRRLRRRPAALRGDPVPPGRACAPARRALAAPGAKSRAEGSPCHGGGRSRGRCDEQYRLHLRCEHDDGLGHRPHLRCRPRLGDPSRSDARPGEAYELGRRGGRAHLPGRGRRRVRWAGRGRREPPR